jgi:hypothetical protein
MQVYRIDGNGQPVIGESEQLRRKEVVEYFTNFRCARLAWKPVAVAITGRGVYRDLAIG